jgi:pyrroloquinoline quinone biosynthesis protein D
MSVSQCFRSEDRPQLNSKFLFRWEKSQNAFVLLYPEGIIKLSDSAAEIIKRCNGTLTVADIIAEIKALVVNATDLEQSINRFLEVSRGKGWINN